MRFKKLEGVDYKRGAEEYAQKLSPSNRHHLLTKPFYNLAHKHERWSGDGLDADSHRHFCDFANIALTLALPPGARILDVGCASGWLCEYFARFGYDVTGIDISADLIKMANERLSKLPFQLDHEHDLSYRFLMHDIEREPLAEVFDAIICYDALHHFEDEHAVLKNVTAMLKPNGQLFIVEGERPPEGSDTERELRNVMRQYETLESPFARDDLLQLLPQYGLAIVGDYVAINGLFERERIDSNQMQIEGDAFNYLLCKKVDTVHDSRNPEKLSARISIRGNYTSHPRPGEKIVLPIELENIGDSIWLVSPAPLKGTVRLGIKVLDQAGKILEEIHGSPRISRAIGPGEKVSLPVSIAAPINAGHYRLKIDLLSQDVCWFEQHGSEPLILPFSVERE